MRWRSSESERGGGFAARRGRGGCAVWLLCTLCRLSVPCAPSLALAQQAGGAPVVGSAAPAGAEPSPAQRETARAWVLEGRRSFAAGDYAAALERYRAAYQLVRVPTAGLELARAQQALGQWVEANATAVEVINLPRSEPEPEVFEQARGAARELLRELSPRVPALQLELSPAEIEARVKIDGEEMPFTRGALPFKLNPGTHEVRVHAAGHRPELHAVTLVERELRTLQLTLHPEEVPSPAPPSSTAPPIFMTDHDEGAGARSRGYVALGVAGAAALVGSVAGVLAFLSKPACPGNLCEAEQRDEAERSRRFGTVANVSFAAALAGAAYGGWELWFHAPALRGASASRVESGASASAARLCAELVPSSGGAVLQLRGAF